MSALPAVVDERLPVRKRRRKSLSMKEIGVGKMPQKHRKVSRYGARSMMP
jgi:hypothetical protein